MGSEDPLEALFDARQLGNRVDQHREMPKRILQRLDEGVDPHGIGPRLPDERPNLHQPLRQLAAGRGSRLALRRPSLSEHRELNC